MTREWKVLFISLSRAGGEPMLRFLLHTVDVKLNALSSCFCFASSEKLKGGEGGIIIFTKGRKAQMH